MSLYGSNVEQGLHCLLYLVERPDAETRSDAAPSSRDLAEFQGVSPSFVAKIFTQLQKAGLVSSTEGIRGGFRLARPEAEITVLDVVDALEGDKPLFQCRDIRRNCVLYGDDPPCHATEGVCGIHAVMLAAEKTMRQTLADHTLADIAGRVDRKLPAALTAETRDWFQARLDARKPPGRPPKQPPKSENERKRT